MANLLELHDFYYGNISHESIGDLFLHGEEGDFIVRKSSKDDLVISVLWGKEVLNYRPILNDGLYNFGAKAFPTMIELINYHYAKKIPIRYGHSTYAMLKRAKLCQIPRFEASDIEIGKKLGEGNFGEVFQVRIKSLNQDAAMKTLRDSVPKSVRDTFMKEFNLMNTMKHKNVVQCIGVVDDKDPNNMKILMELVNKGALDKVLHDSKLTERGKSRILLDAACGIRYLHSRNVIHRDLAARNILVYRDKKGRIVGKVSDFGMSQEGEYRMKESEKIPVKWSAPECLTDHKWTSASDVWSFGVLMWEVWTNGMDPYSDVEEVTDIDSLKQYIKIGGHPSIPNDIPSGLKKIMLACWTVIPTSRPNMEYVLTELEMIHKSTYPSPSPSPTPLHSEKE